MPDSKIQQRPCPSLEKTFSNVFLKIYTHKPKLNLNFWELAVSDRKFNLSFRSSTRLDQLISGRIKEWNAITCPIASQLASDNAELLSKLLIFYLCDQYYSFRHNRFWKNKGLLVTGSIGKLDVVVRFFDLFVVLCASLNSFRREFYARTSYFFRFLEIFCEEGLMEEWLTFLLDLFLRDASISWYRWSCDKLYSSVLSASAIFCSFWERFRPVFNLFSSAIPGSIATPLFLAFSSFPRALSF